MLRILFIDTFISPVWQRKQLWVFYIVAWGLGLTVFKLLPATEYLLMLFTLFVFAIPHNSADFYLPAWILNPPWENRSSYWAGIFLMFGTLAFVTWGLIGFSINLAIALFTALFIWHWGSQDTLPLFPGKGPAWIVGSIGRGLLVVIAPLVFHPAETQALILNLLQAEESHILATLYSFSTHLLVLALFLEVAAYLIHKFAEGLGLPAGMSGHAAETVFLLITFKLTGPMVGLSFYFLLLHSFRSLAVTVDYIPEDRGQMLDTGGLWKRLPYLFQRTNLVTFLAGFILAAWFTWQMYGGTSFKDASLRCLLPFILIMVPHSLISLLTDFNPKRLVN